MREQKLREWCNPRKVLVLMDSSDDRVHAFDVVRNQDEDGGDTQPRYPFFGSDDWKRPLWTASLESREFHAAQFGQDLVRVPWWKTSRTSTIRHQETSIDQVFDLVEATAADRVIVIRRQAPVKAKGGGKSVIDQVLFASPVPVLFTGRSGALPCAETPFHRLLLPLSPTMDIDFAFQVACRLAHPQRALVTVLQVFGDIGTPECATERTPLSVAAQLPIVQARAAGYRCPLEIVVRAGETGSVILETHVRLNVDLIVLGNSRTQQSPAERGMLRRVIEEARCPILVLGPALQAETISKLKCA